MRSGRSAFELYGCKVTRSDLDAILKTMTIGSSPNMRLSLSATRGFSKIDATSLDELLTELDSPTRLRRLDISVQDDGFGSALDNPSRQAVRTSVSLSPSRASVSVSGPNETWVRGRSQELQALLRATRKRPSVEPEIMAALVAVIFALTVELALALSTVAIGIATAPATLASLLGVPVGLGLFVWRWLTRRSVVEVILQKPSSAPWTRGDRIGLAGVVVAVVSLALTAIQPFS